jgi:hypothetical protein
LYSSPKGRHRRSDDPAAAIAAGGLSELQGAEFLYQTRLFPDTEYTFKHALTHEVAYGSLLQERRRTLHASIVAALEGLDPDRLAEQVGSRIFSLRILFRALCHAA